VVHEHLANVFYGECKRLINNERTPVAGMKTSLYRQRKRSLLVAYKLQNATLIKPTPQDALAAVAVAATT